MKTVIKEFRDINRIRRDNLEALAEKYTSYTELKTILGISGGYLSELVSQEMKKTISDKLARNIEQAADMPYGWLDNSHDEQNTVGADVFVPIFKLDQIGQSHVELEEHVIISISSDYCYDFGIKIDGKLETPLLPIGTIALFKRVTEKRLLRSGDIIIARRLNKNFLSYFKTIENKKYLVNINTFKKENLFDEQTDVLAKMVVSISGYKPDQFYDLWENSDK